MTAGRDLQGNSMPFRLSGGFLLAFLLVASIAPGAAALAPRSPVAKALPGAQTEVRASRTNRQLQPILAPDRFAQGGPPPTADIQVTYNGFSQAAHDAFEAAVQVWEAKIVSSRVIHVTANWTPLDDGILGSAGPEALYLWNGIVYPVALYEASCSCESGTSVEIGASFNSNFDAWYLGTDGNAPFSKYDFFTVVMHELGHGLGFMSSFGVSGDNLGAWGYTNGSGNIYPLQFDLNEWSAATGGNKLTNTSIYPDPSAALKTQLTDGSVYFGGANAVAVYGGRVPLYAPSTWIEWLEQLPPERVHVRGRNTERAHDAVAVQRRGNPRSGAVDVGDLPRYRLDDIGERPLDRYDSACRRAGSGERLCPTNAGSQRRLARLLA